MFDCTCEIRPKSQGLHKENISLLYWFPTPQSWHHCKDKFKFNPTSTVDSPQIGHPQNGQVLKVRLFFVATDTLSYIQPLFLMQNNSSKRGVCLYRGMSDLRTVNCTCWVEFEHNYGVNSEVLDAALIYSILFVMAMTFQSNFTGTFKLRKGTALRGRAYSVIQKSLCQL
jgi:hypothetical protein